MFWHLFMPNFSIGSQVVKLQFTFEVKISISSCSYSKEKKRTLSFVNFCLTMDLNHRKSMIVWKLCKKSSKCDVACNLSFILLEMAMVWRKKSLIAKELISILFPISNFSLSVVVNDAAQECLSYSLSMSKSKSFKLSFKRRQEQISNSMRLIHMLE